MWKPLPRSAHASAAPSVQGHQVSPASGPWHGLPSCLDCARRLGRGDLVGLLVPDVSRRSSGTGKVPREGSVQKRGNGGQG